MNAAPEPARWPHERDLRTDTIPVTEPQRRGGIAKWVRTLALPIIIGWVVLIGFLNVSVPQLEEVGQMRSVSMSPNNAPSVIATKRVGTVFEEFTSDSSIMVVLEADRKLDEADRDFYKDMIAKLEADPFHVQHVQDFWGDPLTAAGAQSSDGKATYVQVYTAGNQGEALANESIEAVQDIVYGMQTPPGLKVFVTGPAALAADQQIAGDRSLRMIEALTFTVIIVMLLLIYRSFLTMLITIFMVVLSSAGRPGRGGLPGLPRDHRALDVRHQSVGDAGDRGVHRLRHLPAGPISGGPAAGEDRESAYYTMFHGTAHVVLGSGLTIAGATFCLHFTNLPYFVTLGIPLAVGMTVVVLVALTLGAGDHHRGHPVRQAAGAQAGNAHPRVAQDRRGRGALARTHPGQHHRGHHGRPAGVAGLPDQLQRPRVPAVRSARERGLRGGRPALLAGPDEPGTAAGGKRSRSA